MGFIKNASSNVIDLANQSLDNIAKEQTKLKDSSNSFVAKSHSAQPKESPIGASQMEFKFYFGNINSIQVHPQNSNVAQQQIGQSI